MFKIIFAFKPAGKPTFHGLNPFRNCPDDLAHKVAHQEKKKQYMGVSINGVPQMDGLQWKIPLKWMICVFQETFILAI